MVFINILSFYC